ncbi:MULTISPECIES: dephospho-CoA kinase [unclassified Kitasatospora]|uniref:dephospho-CoA kinase n=1 Tax=unclassified Kitasatospora TaxID=2633591 RepID=UPI00070B1933|nr:MULTISPECIES: dephospho-CoA kinase [unclassified Kitasatospora]KQV19158.1 dephospho-CoA kinase [Kitasatospora sp. Root107]KRB75590.1 dephospho-CoA kinase [Kitasatospora sp. Root187]
MLRIGLTGGIGAGKSEVSRQLAALGALIVDSDLIAREVVAPGTDGLRAVVAEFGPSVLRADGSLDRPALGALVFADPERLAALNAIVHPLVRARSAELEAAAGERDVVVHDVPLLAENGLAPLYDQVVVVDASDEARIDRLVRLRGMTEAEARARMAAQADRETRLAIADLVIDNSGTLAELAPRVQELWETLQKRA